MELVTATIAPEPSLEQGLAIAKTVAGIFQWDASFQITLVAQEGTIAALTGHRLVLVDR